MAWYKTGNVTVTNGDSVVTGDDTRFAANSRVGDGFNGPDGNWYEIVNIASETVLSIYPVYQGATASNVAGWMIAPLQGYNKESADRLRAITDQFRDLDETVSDVKESAAAAKASETAAKTSETNASTSATTATIASNNATQKAVDATNAANTATTKASEAVSSANSAKTSETNAANSASEASAVVVNKQDKNENLTALSGLTGAADRLPYFTGAGALSLATLTAKAREFTALTSESAMRTWLGLTVVSDTQDTTVGRILNVGYGGLGSKDNTVFAGVGLNPNNYRTGCVATWGQFELGGDFGTRTGWLSVFSGDANSVRQTFSDGASNTTIQRVQISGVWLAWSHVIQEGDFGIGSRAVPYITNLNDVSQSGDYRFGSEALAAPIAGFGTLKHTAYDMASNNWTQVIYYMSVQKAYFRNSINSSIGNWNEIYSTGNTNRGSGGVLSAASPIVRIADVKNTERPDLIETGFEKAGDWGSSNFEARGVIVTREEVGVYRITGSIGLAISGWRLHDPQSPDGGRSLGLTEGETLENGDVIVKLFKQRWTINEDDEMVLGKGKPFDVPLNSWIDARLDMPPVDDVTPNSSNELESELIKKSD